MVTTDHEYKIKGVDAQSLSYLSTTCGAFNLTADAAMLITSDHAHLCDPNRLERVCYGTCYLNVRNESLIPIPVASQDQIKLDPFPSIQAMLINVTKAVQISPIKLPSFSNYVVIDYNPNIIYNFNPPLPTGLTLL